TGLLLREEEIHGGVAAQVALDRAAAIELPVPAGEEQNVAHPEQRRWPQELAAVAKPGQVADQQADRAEEGQRQRDLQGGADAAGQMVWEGTEERRVRQRQ